MKDCIMSNMSTSSSSSLPTLAISSSVGAKNSRRNKIVSFFCCCNTPGEENDMSTQLIIPTESTSKVVSNYGTYQESAAASSQPIAVPSNIKNLKSSDHKIYIEIINNLNTRDRNDLIKDAKEFLKSFNQIIKLQRNKPQNAALYKSNEDDLSAEIMTAQRIFNNMISLELVSEQETKNLDLALKLHVESLLELLTQKKEPKIQEVSISLTRLRAKSCDDLNRTNSKALDPKTCLSDPTTPRNVMSPSSDSTTPGDVMSPLGDALDDN